MTKYAVVTCISMFRNRYVVPMDELQKLNPDEEVELIWAEDCVTLEEVKEFSQRHITETIIDSELLDADELLKLFDQDNGYLSNWTEKEKMAWINKWRDND